MISCSHCLRYFLLEDSGPFRGLLDAFLEDPKETADPRAMQSKAQVVGVEADGVQPGHIERLPKIYKNYNFVFKLINIYQVKPSAYTRSLALVLDMLQPIAFLPDQLHFDMDVLQEANH